MMPTRWVGGVFFLVRMGFGDITKTAIRASCRPVTHDAVTTPYFSFPFLSLYFTYLLYSAGVGAGVTYAVGHTAVYAELAVVTTPSVVLTSYTTDSVVMIHLDQGTNASSPFFVPSAGFAMDGSAPLQTVWRVVC